MEKSRIISEIERRVSMAEKEDYSMWVIGVTDITATLQVFADGSLVDIVQVKITENGSYSHVIIAEGPLWTEQGTYLIRVSYGEETIAELNFDYTPKIGEVMSA